MISKTCSSFYLFKQCLKYPVNFSMLRYDWNCYSGWDWAGCIGCDIPRTLTDSVLFTLKGLCAKTQFDTRYQVNYWFNEYYYLKGMKGFIFCSI